MESMSYMTLYVNMLLFTFMQPHSNSNINKQVAICSYMLVSINQCSVGDLDNNPGVDLESLWRRGLPCIQVVCVFI